MTSERETHAAERDRVFEKEPFVSYSLNFEDVILNRLFSGVQNGFYVDVGAGHPYFENDTFLLYQRGWRGVNVEPNHRFNSALREHRPRDVTLEVVASDVSGGTISYFEIDGSGLSTCDPEQAKNYQASGRDIVERQLPVTRLSDIIEEAGCEHINLLKVDVEGFEEKVLDGNNWNKFRPDVVLVEATYPESPIRRPTRIASTMEQRGYRHVHFDGLNDFFLKREIPAPEGLTLPPNVFDHFVPSQVIDLRRQVESLRTSQKGAEEYAISLRAQLDELELEHRRLGYRTSQLTAENQRLWNGAKEMRSELLALTKLLEPLHITKEQLASANARLESVYKSRCWQITAPLRWCDELIRRVTQKHLGRG